MVFFETNWPVWLVLRVYYAMEKIAFQQLTCARQPAHRRAVYLFEQAPDPVVQFRCCFNSQPAIETAREPLHNSGEAVAVGSGWATRRLFAANSEAIGKKNNATGRPSPADHRPQGVMQRLSRLLALAGYHPASNCIAPVSGGSSSRGSSI